MHFSYSFKILFIYLSLFAFNISYLIAKPTSTNKPPKKSYVATIYTKYGEIELLLFDDTPKHRDNFVKLAEQGFYDSTTFHRVLNNFMIQGGDPNSKPNSDGEVGIGGPGYNVEAEIVEKYTHVKGMLAAARMGDRVNPERKSSGSQFYIVQNKKGAHHLDGKYTIFGTVLNGNTIVDNIASVEVKERGRPNNDIRMAVMVKKLKRKKITKLYNYQFSD